MSEPFAQDVQAETTHILPELTAYRSCGDSTEQASIDEANQALGLLLKQRRALGMREQDALSARLKPQQKHVEVSGRRTQRALKQQIRPAAESQACELLAVEIGQAREIDLSTGADVERDALVAQRLGEPARASWQLGRSHPPPTVDVRSGRHDGGSRSGSRASHRDGAKHRGRPVIQARQDVAVQIYHGAPVAARGPKRTPAERIGQWSM